MSKSISVLLTLNEDENGKVIGYSIVSPLDKAPERDSVEREVMERVRDMHFYKDVQYDGRTSYEGTNQTNKLSFIVKELDICSM